MPDVFNVKADRRAFVGYQRIGINSPASIWANENNASEIQCQILSVELIAKSSRSSLGFIPSVISKNGKAKCKNRDQKIRNVVRRNERAEILAEPRLLVYFFAAPIRVFIAASFASYGFPIPALSFFAVVIIAMWLPYHLSTACRRFENAGVHAIVVPELKFSSK
jgi:hypothetical protein